MGDARATDKAAEGSINLGQLVREQLPSLNPAIVGFGTYEGTVVASQEWGSPMRNMVVPPRDGKFLGMADARTETGDQLLLMDSIDGEPLFRESIPQRAIGGGLPSAL